MAKIKTGVSLDEELLVELKKKAKEERRSLSSLVNILLWKSIGK